MTYCLLAPLYSRVFIIYYLHSSEPTQVTHVNYNMHVQMWTVDSRYRIQPVSVKHGLTQQLQTGHGGGLPVMQAIANYHTIWL